MNSEILSIVCCKNKSLQEVHVARDQVRKAKVQTELNLARDIMGNKNMFFF